MILVFVAAVFVVVCVWWRKWEGRRWRVCKSVCVCAMCALVCGMVNVSYFAPR